MILTGWKVPVCKLYHKIFHKGQGRFIIFSKKNYVINGMLNISKVSKKWYHTSAQIFPHFAICSSKIETKALSDIIQTPCFTTYQKIKLRKECIIYLQKTYMSWQYLSIKGSNQKTSIHFTYIKKKNFFLL